MLHTDNKIIRRVAIDNDGYFIGLFFHGGDIIAKEIFRPRWGGLLAGWYVKQFIGNIPDGIVEQQYPDCKLWFNWSYKNNKLNGITEEFNKNGIVMEKRMFKNDRVKKYWPPRESVTSGIIKSVNNLFGK